MSQTHKTDWTPDNSPTDDDFNRIESNIKNLEDGTQPVAKAKELETGLTDFKSASGNGVVEPSLSGGYVTINIGFEADDIIVMTRVGDSDREFKSYSNVSSFSIERNTGTEYDSEGTEYCWIAVKGVR